MAAESEYIYTRDYIENSRLNLGHYQWKELFGCLLHPTIPVVDARLRVCDLATGTGIWLTDISSRLPETVQLDGFDVSLQAVPPVEWLPPNVSFRQWNLKEAVPEDLVGVYDIVHVRHISLVLSDAEIESCIQNIAKLIKPGGYLQWGEMDISSWRVEKSRPGNEGNALEELFKLETAQDSRLSPTWLNKLPQLLSDVGGFGDVLTEKRDPPGHMALSAHECMLLIHENIAKTTGNTAISQGLQELMPLVQEQTRQGACWAFTRWTVVARKRVD